MLHTNIDFYWVYVYFQERSLNQRCAINLTQHSTAPVLRRGRGRIQVRNYKPHHHHHPQQHGASVQLGCTQTPRHFFNKLLHSLNAASRRFLQLFFLLFFSSSSFVFFDKQRSAFLVIVVSKLTCLAAERTDSTGLTHCCCISQSERKVSTEITQTGKYFFPEK